MEGTFSVRSITLNYDGGLSSSMQLHRRVARLPSDIGKILMTVGNPSHPATNHVYNALSELGGKVDIANTATVHNTHNPLDYDMIFVNRPGSTASIPVSFINYMHNAVNNLGIPACLDPTTAETNPDATDTHINIIRYMNLATPAGWTRQFGTLSGGTVIDGGDEVVISGINYITNQYGIGDRVRVYNVNSLTYVFDDSVIGSEYIGLELMRSDPDVAQIDDMIAMVAIEQGTEDLAGNLTGARVVWSNLFYAGQSAQSGTGAPYSEAGSELVKRACLWVQGEF